MGLRTSFRIVQRAVDQFGEDGAAAMGAALAYYTLFSIAPLLILAVSIAGMVFEKEAARKRVTDELEATVGPASAKEITALMEKATTPKIGGALAPVLGMLALMIGALGAFLHLQRSLCAIWKLAPPVKSGLLNTLLNHLWAIVMVLLVGLLLLLSLAASTTLAVVIDVMEQWFPEGGKRWQALEFVVSLVFLTLLFALVFRIMSGRRVAWRHVWYGAMVCAGLFTLGKTLLGLYLAHTSTASAYGAAGALVVFLIWVYYSSQIIFFAAELIQARRTRHEWLTAEIER
jgi:membrane protein